MTAPSDHLVLEEQIAQWRGYLRRRREIHQTDVQELEQHLRDQLEALGAAGLTTDEAFLVAVKRMGSLDALSREFAREHSERLWKQLVMTTAPAGVEGSDTHARMEMLVAVGLALASATAIKLPTAFGLRLMTDGPFYARNASFFVLPLLTIYFVWKRRPDLLQIVGLAAVFAAAAFVANIFPFQAKSQTNALTALHLPIALWLAVGVAYVRGRWFANGGRMDFVRFSGELAIYYVLIALGGGVLTGFTLMMFRAIDLDATWLAQGWLIPCGAMGALIIGSWLVEAKQSVIENMAPVLTRVFTPLFTLVLLMFIGTIIWTRNPINVQRDVLIGFDLLLVLVVGLVLYAASARDVHAAPDVFDVLQLIPVVSALVVDIVTLTAIASRISTFGFTANRTAALGENIILLVNLAGTAWLYAGVVRRRVPFSSLERWQIAYLPVYSAWAALVVVLFPPLFGFQ